MGDITEKNYKVYANIRLFPNRSKRLLPVLYTGAGLNLIHENVLTPKLVKQVKRESILVLRDANKHRVMMKGTQRLRVQLDSFAPKGKFIVCEKLAVSVILGGISVTNLWKLSTHRGDMWYGMTHPQSLSSEKSRKEHKRMKRSQKLDPMFRAMSHYSSE